jgi:ElaB/YqjD/DUF883 family membrane-anchored ribosome-binding protein
MNTSNTADRLMNDAASEVEQLRSQVEQLMTERVTPALGALASNAEQAAKDASHEVRHQVARVSDAVQERPLMALGMAAVAGFVLASLLRR